MMGGALGLAVMASLAEARSDAMRASESAMAALNSGYHLAFLFGAIFAAAAGVAALLFLRREQVQRDALGVAVDPRTTSVGGEV